MSRATGGGVGVAELGGELGVGESKGEGRAGFQSESPARGDAFTTTEMIGRVPRRQGSEFACRTVHRYFSISWRKIDEATMNARWVHISSVNLSCSLTYERH